MVRYRDLHAPITIACDCEQLFDILIDTRQFYRQHLKLRGTCIPPGITMPQRITVQTLSASGVSFHTMPASSLQVDDEVVLWFELDDLHQTVLRLRTVVRWVQDETIGAEFCERRACEEVLGSYLRSAPGSDTPWQEHL